MDICCPSSAQYSNGSTALLGSSAEVSRLFLSSVVKTAALLLTAKQSNGWIVHSRWEGERRGSIIGLSPPLPLSPSHGPRVYNLFIFSWSLYRLSCVQNCNIPLSALPMILPLTRCTSRSYILYVARLPILYG